MPSSGSAASSSSAGEGTLALPPLATLLQQPALWPHAMGSVLRWLLWRWRAASRAARAGVAVLALLYGGLTLAFVVLGPQRTAQMLASAAADVAAAPHGKLGLLLFLFLTALPPLPGYGTAITLCGLAYGSPAAPPVGTHGLFEAWSLAALGCLGGATLSFLIMRGMLRGPGRHWLWVKGIRDDRRWVAMEAAVRGRGTGMVVLIRFCPFPFCYSNLFFAAMSSVSLLQFMLSTALITPKLAIHVYIGARMFELLDSNARDHLDWRGRLLNAAYIVIGSLVGFGTGWYVWRETQSILRAYETEEARRSSEDGEADTDRLLSTTPDDEVPPLLPSIPRT